MRDRNNSKETRVSNATAGAKPNEANKRDQTRGSIDSADRKGAEDGLRKQKEILQTIFDHIPIMISLIDPDLHFQLINREWERKLGWSLEELKDPDLDLLVELYPDAEYREKAKEFIRNPNGEWADFKVRTRDGRSIDTIWTRIQLSDGSSIGIGRDITERRRAEEALRESEERFRQLSEATFEAVLLHENGTILEVNQAFCRLYGYGRAEVIGKSILDLTPPESRELLQQRVRSAGTGPFEGLALRKDGTIFRAELAAKPIHYQGRVVRVAAIRDITEQKRNERRQAAQYAVTRVLAESATLAVATPQLLRVICESLRWKMGEFWRVGDNPNFLRCGETWHVPGLEATSFIEASRQTELAPGAGLPGRVWQSGQPAWIADVTTAPRFARAAIAAKLGLRGAVAFPILAGNQTLGVMLFFSRRAPEVDDELLKIMSAIGSQIGQFTERKRAEESLGESEARYRRIVETAGEGVWQIDAESRTTFVNQRMAEMLGYTVAEMDGASLFEFMDDEGKVVAAANVERRARGIKEQHDFKFQRKDGGDLWAIVSTEPIFDSASRYAGALGLITDITERKRAEESLRKQNEYLAALHETALGLINRLDLNELLEVIVTRALALVGIPGGHVYLLEPGGTEMSVKVGVGVSRDFVGARISKGQGLAGRIWETGQPLVVDDYRNWEHRLTNPGYDALRLVGAVPLRSGSRVVGVLGVESTEDGQGLDQHQVEILNRFAQFASIALDNAQLHSAAQQELAERKRAEEALRESEERYRDLVENSRELICTHDLDGLVLSANPAAAAAIGYGLNELVAKKTIRELLAPEVSHQFAPYMSKLRKEGTTSGIMLVQTRSGERRVWDYYNSLRTDGVAAPIVRGMARDVTDRLRAEQALLVSERKYRDIFTFAPVGICQSLRDGTLTTVNKALAEMLAYDSMDEFLKVNLADVYFTPGEREKLIREYEDLGYASDLELRWKRKDGSPIWVQLSAHAIKGTDGQTKYFEGFVRDITERKRTEMERQVISEVIQSVNLTANLDELLAQVHQSLKRVLYAENCCVALYDKQTGLFEAPFFVDLVEASPFPMTLSKNCTAKVFSSGQPLLMNEAVYAELLDRGEVELVGRPAPSFLAVPLMTPAETIGVIVVQHYEKNGVYSQRDVEFLSAVAAQLARAIERKRAEEALIESDRRFRDLFYDAPVGYHELDTEGRITCVNKTELMMLGYSAEEMLGHYAWEFIVDQETSRQAVANKLSGIEPLSSFERSFCRKDGTSFHGQVDERLLHDPAGRIIGIRTTVQDITDRKRAQEALRIYSQRLIEAQEAERQRIARELHDEIGQVLTAIRINLQSTQRSCWIDGCVPPLDESIGIVDEALGRVRELSLELRPSLLDDLGLTAALRWYVDRYARRTGIIAEVQNRLEEDARLPRELETACFRIAQEALTNVARHAQASSVSVQLDHSPERMLLTIIDDGVGFDLDELRKSASAASALGLRGMEERALALGGLLEIDSGLERGTRIRATFPLKPR